MGPFRARSLADHTIGLGLNGFLLSRPRHGRCHLLIGGLTGMSPRESGHSVTGIQTSFRAFVEETERGIVPALDLVFIGWRVGEWINWFGNTRSCKCFRSVLACYSPDDHLVRSCFLPRWRLWLSRSASQVTLGRFFRFYPRATENQEGPPSHVRSECETRRKTDGERAHPKPPDAPVR